MGKNVGWRSFVSLLKEKIVENHIIFIEQPFEKDKKQEFPILFLKKIKEND